MVEALVLGEGANKVSKKQTLKWSAPLRKCTIEQEERGKNFRYRQNITWNMKKLIRKLTGEGKRRRGAKGGAKTGFGHSESSKVIFVSNSGGEWYRSQKMMLEKFDKTPR